MNAKILLYVALWLFGTIALPLATAQGKDELIAKRVVGMEYPWLARMAVLQGTVQLEATVSKDGAPENIRITSGPEPLATPAMQTLSKWRFQNCQGGATDCTLKITFTFVLKGTCDVSRCPSDFEANLPDQVFVQSKMFDSTIADKPAKSPTR
jgi:TonB family protein